MLTPIPNESWQEATQRGGWIRRGNYENSATKDEPYELTLHSRRTADERRVHLISEAWYPPRSAEAVAVNILCKKCEWAILTLDAPRCEGHYFRVALRPVPAQPACNGVAFPSWHESAVIAANASQKSKQEAFDQFSNCWPSLVYWFYILALCSPDRRFTFIVKLVAWNSMSWTFCSVSGKKGIFCSLRTTGISVNVQSRSFIDWGVVLSYSALRQPWSNDIYSCLSNIIRAAVRFASWTSYKPL